MISNTVRVACLYVQVRRDTRTEPDRVIHPSHDLHYSEDSVVECERERIPEQNILDSFMSRMISTTVKILCLCMQVAQNTRNEPHILIRLSYDFDRRRDLLFKCGNGKEYENETCCNDSSVARSQSQDRSSVSVWKRGRIRKQNHWKRFSCPSIWLRREVIHRSVKMMWIVRESNLVEWFVPQMISIIVQLLCLFGAARRDTRTEPTWTILRSHYPNRNTDLLSICETDKEYENRLW